MYVRGQCILEYMSVRIMVGIALTVLLCYSAVDFIGA